MTISLHFADNNRDVKDTNLKQLKSLSDKIKPELQRNLFFLHHFSQVNQTIAHSAQRSINAAVG